MADDHQAAQSIGIPLNRLGHRVVRGRRRGAGGQDDLGTKLGVQFSLSTIVALRTLPVVILGGLTSVPGAIIGGLIIGVGENSRGVPGSLCGGAHRDLVWVCAGLVFLLFRPQGLFGEDH